VSSADRRERVALGAALGAVGGPAAGFGAAWGGHGDTRAFVWLVAVLVGAALGALAWPVFTTAPAGRELPPSRPGLGFAPLFAGVVGLLAGAFAAFPLGGVFGAGCGAAGGSVVLAAWRGLARVGALPLPARALGAMAVGMGAAVGLAAWWVA